MQTYNPFRACVPFCRPVPVPPQPSSSTYLISAKDNYVIHVDKKGAKKSQIISRLCAIQDTRSASPVPFPKFDKETLEKVAEYCLLFKNDEGLSDRLTPKDLDFLKVEVKLMASLMKAADELVMPELVAVIRLKMKFDYDLSPASQFDEDFKFLPAEEISNLKDKYLNY